MKKILFLIMVVGCFAGLTFGSSPILQNDFSVKNSIGSFPTVNTMLSNKASIKSSETAPRSRRSQCPGPPDPDPNEAVMFPHCADVSGGDDPPADPHGGSHKSAIDILDTEDVVIRYYKWDSNSQTFEFSEEKSALEGTTSRTFYYEYPTFANINSDYVHYKIEVFNVLLGVEVTHGYLEMFYPTFEIPPFE